MDALVIEQGRAIIALPSSAVQKTEPITVGEWVDRWLDKYSHALDEHKRSSVEKLGGIYNAGRGYSRPPER